MEIESFKAAIHWVTAAAHLVVAGAILHGTGRLRGRLLYTGPLVAALVAFWASGALIHAMVATASPIRTYVSLLRVFVVLGTAYTHHRLWRSVEKAIDDVDEREAGRELALVREVRAANEAAAPTTVEAPRQS